MIMASRPRASLFVRTQPAKLRQRMMAVAPVNYETHLQMKDGKI
jgi:hypothetical protein